MRSKWAQNERREAFEYYMTDALYAQCRGEALTKRFYDVMTEKVDDRTAEEIIMDTIERAGLIV